LTCCSVEEGYATADSCSLALQRASVVAFTNLAWPSRSTI